VRAADLLDGLVHQRDFLRLILGQQIVDGDHLVEGFVVLWRGVPQRVQRDLERHHLLQPIDHDRHAVLALPPDDLLDLVAQLAGRRLRGLRLIPRVRHVVFHRVQEDVPDGQRHGREAEHDAEDRDGARRFHHEPGERAAVTTPQSRHPALLLAQRQHALEGHQDGGQEEVRRAPAEQHARAADHAEVFEAAEVGHHQRAVGDHGCACGGQRGEPGLLHRHGDARFGLLAAPLFEVTRHEDDAEVDAVADDDADQEARGRVQVADGEVGEAERPEHADGHGERHGQQRAEPQIEEENDAEDHGDAELSHVREVVLDLVVLLGAGDEIPPRG
jgi:hypothetical protein